MQPPDSTAARLWGKVGGMWAKFRRFASEVGFWGTFGGIVLAVFSGLVAMIAFLANQWQVLAAQGWAALLLTAITVSSLIIIAVSLAYWVFVGRRMRPNPPDSNAAGIVDILEDALQGGLSRLSTLENKVEALGHVLTTNGDIVNKRLEELQISTASLRSDFSKHQPHFYRALRAQYSLLRLDRLSPQIERSAALLDRPIRDRGINTDWTLWNIRYSDFRRKLAIFARLVKEFRDVDNLLFTVPSESLKSQHWTFPDSIFPNHDQALDFKSYRIILSNYREISDEVTSNVMNAALGSG